MELPPVFEEAKVMTVPEDIEEMKNEALLVLRGAMKGLDGKLALDAAKFVMTNSAKNKDSEYQSLMKEFRNIVISQRKKQGAIASGNPDQKDTKG